MVWQRNNLLNLLWFVGVLLRCIFGLKRSPFTAQRRGTKSTTFYVIKRRKVHEICLQDQGKYVAMTVPGIQVLLASLACPLASVIPAERSVNCGAKILRLWLLLLQAFLLPNSTPPALLTLFVVVSLSTSVRQYVT